ncbi:ATP-binding cassette domain-containing protein [Pradoshia sp.]
MIKIENMNYSYGDMMILKDISLQEMDPVITGLWGRNGSGKTTLMKLMAGHLKPDNGTIQINGLEPYNNLDATQTICFMQEDHPFGILWDVQDALRFASYFNEKWNKETAEQLLETFGLPRKKKVSKLSKGMKSALQIVIGLASYADVTILDEPTNGLDAGIRKKFYKALQESYEKHPRLFLISTHHIEEIQLLLESLIVIHNQRVLFHESMDEVRMRGIWFAGDKEKVENLIKSQKVLAQDRMGSNIKVMVDLPYSREWKQKAAENGISIEKAHIQDYLLTISEAEVV